MIFRWHGGFGKAYNGQQCDWGKQTHTFAIPDFHYSVCECGESKQERCSCAECGERHIKAIPTTPEDRLHHEIYRLQMRVALLEQPLPVLDVSETESTDAAS